MSWLDRFVGACLEHRAVVAIFAAILVVVGLAVSPFPNPVSELRLLDPVPVDAIPDLGENQQIILAEWPGRSPQTIEDQVTYPLTVALLGVPGIRTVRSQSFFGFSTIYVVFQDDVEFYWSRSRLLEKIASLPPNTLPPEVRPQLGPDATALGQIYWYTLEGRDEDGRPAPGWSTEELRSIQDFYVRYALAGAEGVAEVSSVGGFVREYQVEVDPHALHLHGLTIDEVVHAVRASNTDVGARTIEFGQSEYVVRGLGFLEGVEDLEKVVVSVTGGVPRTLKDVAHVAVGPAMRRGVLDKNGAEAVGGVVVSRFGEDVLSVLENVQERIDVVSAGLPSKTLEDGRTSTVTIVPFYDRSRLIQETLATLENAISHEVLITIVVVLVMVNHLRTSMLVVLLLPLAILGVFVAMKAFGVQANVVALAGIAIAIGTLVDLGIVIGENILRHVQSKEPSTDLRATVRAAVSEVAAPVGVAILTTLVSFLPVFTLTAAEGKLFRPLAFTKTFTLIAAAIVAFTLLPVAASWLHSIRRRSERPSGSGTRVREIVVGLVAAAVLSVFWMPLGSGRGWIVNLLFVAAVLVSWLLLFRWIHASYGRWLSACLAHRRVVAGATTFVLAFGFLTALGSDRILLRGAQALRGLGVPAGLSTESWPVVSLARAFPGIGAEFMPRLDEGSYLYMPTTMPHASIGEALDVLQKIDLAIAAVPEVESVIGKIGRVESALDPAPISMVEAVVNYLPEFRCDEDGRTERFRWNARERQFVLTEDGDLIPDRKGRPYRQWREFIRSPDDIWDELVKVAELPGTTSAPKLAPISARLVMLQSGMRAPFGVKIQGPDLATIERFSFEVQERIKRVPGVLPATVVADRPVGKPYLEIDIDRDAIAGYGLRVADVQRVVEAAIGGREVTRTVEGRERYAVRVRYARELRNSIEAVARVFVPTPSGAQIPLGQLADIRTVRGPQVIKSEDTFLVTHVLFDKEDSASEREVARAVQQHLRDEVERGSLSVPAGVRFELAGTWENQVRSERALRIVVPLALLVIWTLLLWQFRSVGATALVFLGVLLAWSGGFSLLWLFGQSWFLGGSLAGVSLREVFSVSEVNLSVAVWVGFLALFGIATDAGVVLGAQIRRRLSEVSAGGVEEVRAAIVQASTIRARAVLATTATTILALLPVFTSQGRGAEIVVPMAIPILGGMIVQIVSLFVVPVGWSWIQERRIS